MDAFAPISVSFVLNQKHWELVCKSHGVIDVRQNGIMHENCKYHVEKFYMKNGVIPSYSPVHIGPSVLYSIFNEKGVLVDVHSRANILERINASNYESSKREQMQIRTYIKDLLEVPQYDEEGLQIQCIALSGSPNNLDITIYSLMFKI
jgi:hypothetical protein